MIQDLKDKLDSFDGDCIVKHTEYLWSSAIPKPKQSVQFGMYGAFTPKDKRLYVENLVKDLYNSTGYIFKDIIRLTVIYNFPFLTNEKDWSFKTTRPDLDNLSKPLMDALSGIWIAEDAKIAVLRAKKIKYKFPCIAVKLEEIVELRN